MKAGWEQAVRSVRGHKKRNGWKESSVGVEQSVFTGGNIEAQREGKVYLGHPAFYIRFPIPYCKMFEPWHCIDWIGMRTAMPFLFVTIDELYIPSYEH